MDNINASHMKTVGYLLWIFGFTGSHPLTAMESEAKAVSPR